MARFVPTQLPKSGYYQKIVGHGMRQAIDYAMILDVNFAHSSNGHAFLEHGMATGT